jgi:hypothetical protein
MGQKPKARAAKSKKKSATSGKSETERTQAERFIEAARDIGVDETGREFDRALGKIIPAGSQLPRKVGRR